MVINVINNHQTTKINVKSPITGREILLQHYPELQPTTLAYILDGTIKDLSWPIKDDNATIEFVQQKDQAALSVLNYTCGLTVAYVVQKLYQNAKIAVVKTTDDGFYLDIADLQNLKGQDLTIIANEVKKIAHQPLKFQRLIQTVDEAVAAFKDNPYAREYSQFNHVNGIKCSYLINESHQITAAGVASSDSQIVTHFALLAVTGAYWLGNEKNQQLQRITGVCAWTKADLVKKLSEIADRKLHDHREINKKLNVFTFNDDIGKGLPLFLPNGMIIKKALQQFLREKEFKWGYQEVSTPVLGSVSLYQKSGHWNHYRENMFDTIEHEQEKLVLRPMTCPHHCMIYQSQKRSYRDLPLRLSENALLYRYEASGALTGLERVRSMELTDAHLFVRPDQINAEFKRCFHLIDEVLRILKIEIDYYSLSLRDEKDKEKYYDDDAMWNKAETELKAVLDELKINYKIMIGEAAFYGPKFDVQIKTPIGHEVTISTIQFDFLLPQKFDLSYVDRNNQSQKPIIIHRGLIGTYERFIATLLEQTKGIFPLWLAPVQVAILPVNNQNQAIIDYCTQLSEALIDENIRVQRFDNDGIGKRIKNVHEQKIPYVIVIGEKEVSAQQITYHSYQSQKQDKTISQSAFITLVKNQIKLYQ